MGEYYKEIVGLIKGNSCEAKKFRDSEDRFLFFEELFEKTLDTERITNEVVRHVTRELELNFDTFSLNLFKSPFIFKR